MGKTGIVLPAFLPMPPLSHSFRAMGQGTKGWGWQGLCQAGWRGGYEGEVFPFQWPRRKLRGVCSYLRVSWLLFWLCHFLGRSRGQVAYLFVSLIAHQSGGDSTNSYIIELL